LVPGIGKADKGGGDQMRKFIAGTLIVLTFVASPAHAASITLGCSGTTASEDWSAAPTGTKPREYTISRFIVVNLDQKTVSGLAGTPWADWDDSKNDAVYPSFPIIATDENYVVFEARKERPYVQVSIRGHIHRITGILTANEIINEVKTTSYNLRCSPTKRLF
jgi:hypothetical protein